jgi:hypothetical protein
MAMATALFGFGRAAPLAAAERWSIGLTTNGAPIEALVVPGASESALTVLLLGGLQGSDASGDTAIPLANPDTRVLQFPPMGTA